MKRTIFLSAFVALLVSAMTIGGFYYLNDDVKESSDKVSIEKIDGQASNVLYTKDSEGNVQPLNFESTAAKVMDAVVSVQSKIENPMANRQEQFMNPFRRFFEEMPGQRQNRVPEYRMGTGSGVIINKKGYIITNNHVIDKAKDVSVKLHDNREYDAEVIGTDPTTDLALLKINDADDLTTLPLVNSDEVKVGEWVLAVGNPFNLTSTVTAGIVSAKARNINILDNKYAVESFIQTDAAINKGNSGGALVNLQGGLIGINSAIFSPSGAYSGYGFAIPSNLVSKVVEDLLEYGTVQRGFLGVSISNITSELAEKKNIEVNKGVYIAAVQENSAAANAGIKEGDIVTKVDDHKVNSSPELQELIARKRPGDKVNIGLLRNGKEKQVVATLYNRNGTTEIVKEEYTSAAEELGIKLRSLSDSEAADLNVEGGVLIEEIGNGRIASETSIREGFIILEVDGQKVTSTDDVDKIIADNKGDYVEIKGVYQGVPGVYYYGIGLNN